MCSMHNQSICLMCLLMCELQAVYLAQFMVKMETRPRIPSPLLEMRAHVAVFLFCYCGPAGTLSDVTSVPSEPGVTSCSHRCHGFSMELRVFSRRRLPASCFNSATHIVLALQWLTVPLLKLPLCSRPRQLLQF